MINKEDVEKLGYKHWHSTGYDGNGWWENPSVLCFKYGGMSDITQHNASYLNLHNNGIVGIATRDECISSNGPNYSRKFRGKINTLDELYMIFKMTGYTLYKSNNNE